MRKLVLALVLGMFLCTCATDVVVTSGAVAEGKKEEIEQAQKNKQDILDKYEEQRKAQEERKKEMEEQ